MDFHSSEMSFPPFVTPIVVFTSFRRVFGIDLLVNFVDRVVLFHVAVEAFTLCFCTLQSLSPLWTPYYSNISLMTLFRKTLKYTSTEFLYRKCFTSMPDEIIHSKF